MERHCRAPHREVHHAAPEPGKGDPINPEWLADFRLMRRRDTASASGTSACEPSRSRKVSPGRPASRAADDSHHRHRHFMRRHDAPRKGIGAVIGNGPDPGIPKRRQNVRAVSGLVFRDRRDRDLVRRQPERKHAAMVLEQDRDHAAERSEDGVVDHQRPRAAAVGGDVGRLEPLRQHAVELHGAALPGSPRRSRSANSSFGP